MARTVVGLMLLWLMLAGTAVLAQGPERLDVVLPDGIYYAYGPEVLAQETVDALRAIPIQVNAEINAANEWANDRGAPWMVEWETVYGVWLDGGGDAILAIGRTSNPGLMLVTVGYERNAEPLANGYVAWHCERAAIWTAAIANVGMAAYFLLTISLPSAGFWGGQDAFAQTLAIVPRITIASIIAELVSELIDTEVYHRLMHRVSERHQWARVLGSNAVSLPIDTLIFGSIAFLGTMPLAGIWAIVLSQIAFKAVVTLVSLPLIYAVPSGSVIGFVTKFNVDGVRPATGD